MSEDDVLYNKLKYILDNGMRSNTNLTRICYAYIITTYLYKFFANDIVDIIEEYVNQYYRVTISITPVQKYYHDIIVYHVRIEYNHSSIEYFHNNFTFILEYYGNRFIIRQIILHNLLQIEKQYNITLRKSHIKFINYYMKIQYGMNNFLNDMYYDYNIKYMEYNAHNIMKYINHDTFEEELYIIKWLYKKLKS